MKKLLALGTMVVLMLAATSPAFAQAIADDGAIADDSDVTTLTVEFTDASQFQAAAALQVNEGSANAAAADDSVATASIDQSLTIEQTQINGAVGGVWIYYY